MGPFHALSLCFHALAAREEHARPISLSPRADTLLLSTTKALKQLCITPSGGMLEPQVGNMLYLGTLHMPERVTSLPGRRQRWPACPSCGARCCGSQASTCRCPGSCPAGGGPSWTGPGSGTAADGRPAIHTPATPPAHRLYHKDKRRRRLTSVSANAWLIT